jgi:hypothetical protein
MTLFEYIKNEATIEQIAQIFDNLENDSGYYDESNVSALWYVLEEPEKYEKLTECSNSYELAIKELNKNIEKK